MNYFVLKNMNFTGQQRLVQKTNGIASEQNEFRAKLN